VKDEDRIALHVLLELVLGAVGPAHRIRHRVAHEPVGSHLDQRWPLLFPGSLDRARHALAHREDVLAIHRLAVHSITLGADEHIFVGRRARDRGPHAVAIVLDDEDDGEIPQRGQIQSLVKSADVDGRLSEEADANLITTAILDRESDSGGDRNVATHDAMSAEEVCLGVEDVHGAALAARGSCVAAKQLGHDCSRADSACERLPMIAVGGDHVIIGTDHRHHAGRDRFLSDVEVQEPADLSERVPFGAPLLETTLEEHRMKQLAPDLRRGSSELTCRWGISAVVSGLAFLPLLLGRSWRALRFSAHTPAACTCSHA